MYSFHFHHLILRKFWGSGIISPSGDEDNGLNELSYCPGSLGCLAAEAGLKQLDALDSDAIPDCY